MTEQMLTRAAVATGTVDPESRTVELVFATTAPVKRYSWEEGHYTEILSIDHAAIDAARMNAGSMSLLDSHDQRSMDARLGAVLPGSFRIEGDRAVCKVKFSRRERADAIFQDIVDGLTTPVSVGYRVLETAKTEGKQGSMPVVTATRWQPLEISLCPVPADGNSHTRAHEEATMPHPYRRSYSAPNPELDREIEEERRALEESANRRLTLREAREFAVELTEAVSAARYLPELQARITRGMSESDVRGELLRIQVEEQERSPTFPHVETRGMQDATETSRKLAANAILHRHGIVDKLEEGAGQYRGMSIVEIARDLLTQRGENSRGSASEVLSRGYHTSSDFTAVLTNVVDTTVARSYASYSNTFQLIAHRNVVNDLREVKVVELGDAPDLEKVNEHGEFTSGTMRESEEGFSIAHYGKIFSATEHLLINDRLDAITKAISEWGRKAAQLEGDLVWGAIINNHRLKSDNKALFHADHGNLAANGTVLDITNLKTARLAFRQQKDIDGRPINISPKYLFTGSALEIDAQTLTTSITNPLQATDVVPQAIKSLVPVFEHRLDDIATKAWFLFASAADTFGRGLQFAHLAGQESPRIVVREGFEIAGIDWRIDHYFGAGLTDFRFGYKNPGA